MDTNTFAEKLKALRDEKGLSIREMADFLGSTRGKVWRYEKGDEPDMSFVVAVANKCGVSIGWLAGNLNTKDISLPSEYIELAHEAYESGLTPDEIRSLMQVAKTLKK